MTKIPSSVIGEEIKNYTLRKIVSIEVMSARYGKSLRGLWFGFLGHGKTVLI